MRPRRTRWFKGTAALPDTPHLGCNGGPGCSAHDEEGRSKLGRKAEPRAPRPETEAVGSWKESEQKPSMGVWTRSMGVWIRSMGVWKDGENEGVMQLGM